MVSRTVCYFDDLQDDSTDVIVPAPAVAEFLHGLDKSRHEVYLRGFRKNFILQALDLKAANGRGVV